MPGQEDELAAVIREPDIDVVSPCPPLGDFECRTVLCTSDLRRPVFGADYIVGRTARRMSDYDVTYNRDRIGNAEY